MTKVKKFTALLLCVLLLVTSLPIGLLAFAKEYPVPGIITGDYVRLREGPSTSTKIIKTTRLNQKVTVTDEVYNKNKDHWYAVILDTGEKGYMFAEYIELIIEYNPDTDFEKYLDSEGFPESYKDSLRKLHAVYPSWRFVADRLSHTFSETLDMEARVGKSLVGVNYEAWRTMEAGAYNWDEGKYISLDNGGWYAAHRDVVAYYLDPRNFLNSNSIFQFIGMSFNKTFHTKEGLQNALKGTFMEGDFPEKDSKYKTWADVLMAASEESNMSPYSLAAMILQEQGNDGSGALISGNQRGYENLYNFLSIHAFPNGGLSAVANGLEYARSKGWNTREKAIFGGADWYVKQYIAFGQDTGYYKKFDVSGDSFGGHQYMTNIQAAEHEGQKTKKAYVEMLDKQLLFKIPVYKDMPAAAAEYPTTQGNNNFYLDSLDVEGYSLNSVFNFYNNTYELIANGNVDEINVSAKAKDSGASVSGNGTHSLKEGINKIDITVTATSGRKNIYTILVEKKKGPDSDKLTFNTGNYKFSDSVVTKIPRETSSAAFIFNLSVKNGTAVIYNSKGEEKTGMICTGDILEIKDKNGKIFASYKLSIKGDISGDGRISLIDLAKVQAHLLEMEGRELKDVYFVSADINEDGRISLIDLAKVQAHLLEIKFIE